MVDALFSGRDVQARIGQQLPPELRPLAAPATGLLRRAAVPAAEELLERPATQRLWREANRRAHQRLVALLDQGGNGQLMLDGPDVVLDLAPLVDRLGERLGISPELPPGAGQVTILRSDRLGQVQETVRVIRTLSSLILIAVAVLIVLAVYLAEGFRRRMLVSIGVGLVAVGALLLVARRVVGDELVERLTDPTTRAAGEAVWLIGTDVLRDLALGLLLYGAVLLAGTWLAGPAPRALAARRRLAPVARDHGAWLWGVVAGLFVAILIWGPATGSRRLLGILVLAALVIAGVALLRRQIVRESAQRAPRAR